MSADRDALLAAIRAAPDDDTPRLVFADWLEEHGDAAFAQFIRLEVERDRLPPEDPRREDLDRRAHALRKAFPGYVGDLNILSPTRRGFHADIQAGLLGLRAGLDRLGPYAPRLSLLVHGNSREEREATEEQLATAFREVFASAWARQWVELELHSLRVTAEHVRWMAGPGNLAGLRQLVFAGGLDDDAVRALGEADLPRLEVLAVHELRQRDEALLTPAALVALGESPLLARLEHLSLMGEWIGDDGLRALAASPQAGRLPSLHLWTRGHTPAGLRALVESPRLSGLRCLDMPWVDLDPETAALLARPEVLPGLTRLGVRSAPDRAALARRFGDGLLVDEDEDRSDGAE